MQPEQWREYRLGDVVEKFLSGGTPSTSISEYWNGDIPWITGADAEKKIMTTARQYVSLKGVRESSTSVVPKGNILLVTRTGVGKVSIAGVDVAISQDLTGIIPDPSLIDAEYLFWQLKLTAHDRIRLAQGTIIEGIQREEVEKLPIPAPSLPEQRKIARILTTVDNLIERTEALIAKYQAVKQGLLHDLLTRGVDAQGRLRPPREEAPDLYKESPLGWIPREWEVAPLKSLVDSAVDGPFGSNLKIEHYVKEPGVRVVRLQNIANGYFDESDRAYISTSHAQYLKRHEVVAGDLLVASMGDDNHLIARACLYPDHLQAGIVKADCFRLRLLEHMADHGFVMHMLNCSSTRDDIDKFAQGVTRNRVNLGNLQKVRLRVPPVAEQQIIAKILFALDQKIETEANTLMKLRVVKAGLMQDLLTGKVHVGAGEDVLFDIACSQHTTESVDDAL